MTKSTKWIVFAVVAVVLYHFLTPSKSAAGDLSTTVNGIQQYDTQGTPAHPVYGIAGVDYPVN